MLPVRLSIRSKHLIETKPLDINNSGHLARARRAQVALVALVETDRPGPFRESGHRINGGVVR